MRYLHDSNLILALTHEDHPFHRQAFAWFRGTPTSKWATCEITRSALIRLSYNPRVIDPPKSPVETLNNLETAACRSDHKFLTLPRSGIEVLRKCLTKCQGYKQITDAYLIAIAISNNVKLATFDARLRHLSPDPEAVELVSSL